MSNGGQGYLFRGLPPQYIYDMNLSMEEARRRTVGQIMGEIKRELPWKLGKIQERYPGIGEYPEQPGAMSVLGKNILRGVTFGTTEGAEAGPFTTYDVGDLEYLMREADYSEADIERFKENLTAQDLLSLKYSRPEILSQSGMYGAAVDPDTTPEERDLMRRQLLGLGMPEEPEEWKSVADYLYPAERPREGFLIPERDELVPRNYIDTKTGETVNYTAHQMLALQQVNPGRYQIAPREERLETRELGKKAADAIEMSSVELFAEIDNLKFVQSIWDPNYLTAQGKIQNKLLRWVDWLAATTPEQQAWLVRRSMAFAGAASTLNATIKRITGAQMSAQEADRIKLETIDPEKDTPSEFKGKLLRLIYMNGLAVARNQILVEKGIVEAHQKLSGEEWSKLMSFEGVRQHLLNTANEMTDAYLAQGHSPGQAEEMTEHVMMERYGVHPRILVGSWMEANVPIVLEAFHSLPAGIEDAGTRLSPEDWEAGAEVE